MTIRSTEALLILGLRQGDTQAFSQPYARYYDALFRVISRIVGDPIETQDLLQDTYVKVWQRFHYFDRDNYFVQRVLR